MIRLDEMRRGKIQKQIRFRTATHCNTLQQHRYEKKLLRMQRDFTLVEGSLPFAAAAAASDVMNESCHRLLLQQIR